MIRRPPRSTHCISSAASDVYKRQGPRDAAALVRDLEGDVLVRLAVGDDDAHGRRVLVCLLYTSPSPRD